MLWSRFIPLCLPTPLPPCPDTRTIRHQPLEVKVRHSHWAPKWVDMCAYIHIMTHMTASAASPSVHAAATSREEAIERAVCLFDDPMFRALQEPARVAVLRRLMLLGRADVNQIAEGLPQERSVVSRHLQQLLDAGLLHMERAGKHRIYQVDGPAILGKFENIWRQMSAVAPWCCPSPASDPKA